MKHLESTGTIYEEEENYMDENQNTLNYKNQNLN